MSVCPGAPLSPAVAEAIERLEAAGLAIVLAWRPCLGGSWSTAFANPILAGDEWADDIRRSMAARVAAELLHLSK
jgi:hypothetical protein